MLKKITLLAGVTAFLLFFSCSKSESASGGTARDASAEMPEPVGEREAFIEDYWRWTFGDAGLPDELAKRTAASLSEGPDFVMELLELLREDPYIYALVDKQHPLAKDYVPGDLVELSGGTYSVTRSGLTLRRAAAESLDAMADAAKQDGVTLGAASAYRSYDYQAGLYARNVAEMGKEAADRESAMPGHSQHQLGLALDFYPIDDAFAETAASAWLENNAGRFGWSLSFPEGYEEVTGYRWESWHYRYVGKDLAAFIDKYFDGIQQYALQFIRAWAESSGEAGASVNAE